jgi:nucleoside-diphosphate-sugar epimerase
MSKSILIAGCGFVGLPLARSFASSGWRTWAITRSAAAAADLQREPFRVDSVDIADTASLRRLSPIGFEVVVHCASSGRGGASAYQAVYFRGAQNLIDRLRPKLFILAGSTSVYGQMDGSWVDEQSLANPAGETGKILRKTEDIVLDSNGMVARLAGLYGPGRCVPLEKLARGTALIEGDGERVMNMLHRVDAVDSLRFLVETGLPGIFNLVDNQPVTQGDWFLWTCDQLKKPLPPYGPRDLNRKRGWTNKRVSNRKLRSLGWNPRYPTFKEGIGEILSDGRPRPSDRPEDP